MTRSETPFYRARAIALAVASAMASGMNFQSIQQLYSYQSNGHGRGAISGKSMRNRYSQGGRAYPQNGEREMARRRRQIFMRPIDDSQVLR